VNEPSAPEQLRRRHPAIALIAGQLAPGLGFMLTGRPLLAVTTWLAFAVAILALPVLMIDGHAPWGPELLLSVHYIVFSAGCLLTAIAAAVLAVKDPPRRFGTLETPWLVLGFVVVSFAARHALWTRLLDRYVVTYALVPETSMAPDYAAWAKVSIIKRGFQPHKIAINDVVGIAANTTGWSKPYPGVARVIATAGSVVVVDEKGDISVDGFPVVRTPCPATVPHNGMSCTAEKQATPQGAVFRNTTSSSFPRTFTSTTVGLGQVFVLTDDRGRKLEAPAGLIAVSDILGRVVPVR
jgi:hypothetical protein